MVEVFGGYVAEVCLTIMVQMQWAEGKHVFFGISGKMGKLELQENTGWLIYTYTTTLKHRGQPGGFQTSQPERTRATRSR